MCDKAQNCIPKSPWRSVLQRLLTFSSVSLFAFSLGLPVLGQPKSLINWVEGPAKASLGDYADISIPQGYRFAPADQARNVLNLMNQQAPAQLVGILAPASGKWMIIFEFADIGFVKDDGKATLDNTAILETLRQKMMRQVPKGALATVDWDVDPEYNPEQHSLEWAIRAQGPGATVVNHYVCLFGRHGILNAIAVQPRQLLAETIPLKKLMCGVSFRDGYGYADYRSGDKASARSLASIITADDSADVAAAASGLSRTQLILISAGGAVLIGVGVGAFLLVRAFRRKEESEKEPWGAEPVRAHTNGSTTAVIAAPAALPQRANHVNGKNGHPKTRRRMFNYQKYYSDLLMQVSDRAYEGFSSNGGNNRNGSSSRHHSPAPAAAPAPIPVSAPDGSPASAPATTPMVANLGLIESQRNLIEEQQRLIREQTKLIEEKTRLIHEKNQVLEKQTELFGNNSF
jgi:uncharacterized membrane-anchored protein